jgi:hypothetical protein
MKMVYWSVDWYRWLVGVRVWHGYSVYLYFGPLVIEIERRDGK